MARSVLIIATALFGCLCSSMCSAQVTALQIARTFAEQYEPRTDDVEQLKKVPANVIKAFEHLSTSEKAACEKYLSLIFIRIYRAHLECCNQSYELRTWASSGIDRTADPLLFIFNGITGKYATDKPIEFISSGMAYDWVNARAYLRNDPAIKKELAIVKKKGAAIRQGKI